jgi:hypothetical protein
MAFSPSDLRPARAETSSGDPKSSAAVSELDRQARVGTRSTESLVDARATSQEVILGVAEELVSSSLAEETICASGSAKIVKASSAIDAVVTFARIHLVSATACADDIPPTPASDEVGSAACDDDISMARPHDAVCSRGAGHRCLLAMTERRVRRRAHRERADRGNAHYDKRSQYLHRIPPDDVNRFVVPAGEQLNASLHPNRVGARLAGVRLTSGPQNGPQSL